MKYELQTGDCRELLKTIKSNSVSTVITDPPYGLSKEPDIADVLTHWINGDDYEHGQNGFMSRSWDSFVPGPSVWREVYRVMKPGAYLICFGGTRTFDLMTIAIRLAGFSIVDSIAWLYASGMPHGLNVSKAIDREAGAERGTTRIAYGSSAMMQGLGVTRPWMTEAAKKGYHEVADDTPIEDLAHAFDGYNTALAPSHEPIVVAMKPRDGTYANNAAKHGVAGFWIDGGRIAASRVDIESVNLAGFENTRSIGAEGNGIYSGGKFMDRSSYTMKNGRWPKNTILQHTDECVLIGTESIHNPNGSIDVKGVRKLQTNQVYGERMPRDFVKHGDENGNETVERWDCPEYCPVRILGEQTGELSSRPGKDKVTGEGVTNPSAGAGFKSKAFYPGDTGTAARYFYQAKASRSERNSGCEELFWRRDKAIPCGFVAVAPDEWEKLPKKQRARGNCHSTVKPIDLIRYLVRLTRIPTGGLVLDPFSGSGTTGVACVIEDINYFGIDLFEEHNEIANCRIQHALEKAKKEQPELDL